MRIITYNKQSSPQIVEIVKRDTNRNPGDPDYISKELEIWDIQNGQDKANEVFDLPCFAFKDSVVENKKYIITQLHIPSPLLKDDPGAGKYKYSGLFLLRPTIGSRWFKEPPYDHGEFGCPIAVEPSGDKNARSDGPKSFEFQNNYYYPLVLSNWQSLFFITEKKNAWEKYKPKKRNISIDFPASYDTTFGIYSTRAISFPKKDEEQKNRSKKSKSKS